MDNGKRYVDTVDSKAEDHELDDEPYVELLLGCGKKNEDKDRCTAEAINFICKNCQNVFKRTENQMKSHVQSCKIQKHTIPMACDTCDFRADNHLAMMCHYIENVCDKTSEIEENFQSRSDGTLDIEIDENAIASHLKDSALIGPVLNKSKTQSRRSQTKGKSNSKASYYAKILDRYCDTCKIVKTGVSRSVDSIECDGCAQHTKLQHQCSKCKTVFPLYMNAKYHARTKCYADEYFCDYCHLKLKTKSTIKKHILRFHLPSELFPCQSCDFKTNDENKYITHLRKKHLPDQYLTCKQCLNWHTQNQDHLRRHELRKHSQKVDGPKVKCEICGYKTSYPAKLSDHIQRNHPNKK